MKNNYLDNQNLFNTIYELTGVSLLQSELEQIIDAIKIDVNNQNKI